MKSRILVFIAVLTMAMVLGCPNGGINLSRKNSVTLHNNHTMDITSFSVSRLGEICQCPEPTKVGVNVLPEPLKPGESFKVADLVDGNYELSLVYYHKSDNRTYSSSRTVTQSLEGGKNYDWYFTMSKSADSTGEWVPGAPSAKAILDTLLGL